MADLTLSARSPLEGMVLDTPGCALRERPHIALTSLACPLDGGAEFETFLSTRFSLPRPTPRKSTAQGDCRALAMTPDQVLLLHPSDDAVSSSAAYVTDQTGAWCVLELSGARAHEALMRLCPIDLHESVFPVDHFARTVMEHMSAVVIRTGAEQFLLLSASSSAQSFWHAVTVSMKNLPDIG